MARRVDAHQHFWRYDPAEYGWIGDSMSLLRRDFLPGDLLPEMRAQGIDASIAVQARQTVQETEWLLDLAASDPAIAGVVGWMPLASGTLEEELAALPNRSMLKGLRHVLQDELDDTYMLSEGFGRGIKLLTGLQLTYDILIYERQLPGVLEFVDRYPGQVFVLDHIAKPRIAEDSSEPWRQRIRDLAQRPNVFCKLSGMVTEADWNSWGAEDLRPYFDAVLESFGPERLMFGSDWPVCLLASSYARWVQTVQDLTAQLSEPEQTALWGGTAVKAYRLTGREGEG